MTASGDRSALVERLQAGRARARAERPSRLAALERRMDQLGQDYKAADADGKRRIRRELRDLGQERLRLKYPGGSE